MYTLTYQKLQCYTEKIQRDATHFIWNEPTTLEYDSLDELLSSLLSIRHETIKINHIDY